MAERSNSELIDAIDDVLLTTLSIARDLTEDDADRATECPGWTVRDQLAHMVGLEQVLHGAPPPTVELPPAAHVVNEFDEFMERQVHVRRQLPLSAIADELAGLRPRRTASLRRSAAEGDPAVRGPFGDRPLSLSLPIRVFDLWTHEQDIRRAVGLPVRSACVAAEVSLERSVLGWAAVLPSRVDDVDGVLEIGRSDADADGSPVATLATVEFGRGGAEATLVGDVGQLTRCATGRSRPSDDELTGDPSVVAAVRDQLALTP